MRSIFALIALSLSVAAPAQFVGKPVYEPVYIPSPLVGDSSPPGPGIRRELRQIHHRIDRARHNGELTRREARQLHREARLIGRAAGRYGRDGLSASERRELQNRTRVLRDGVNATRAQASSTSGPVKSR